MHLPSPKHMCTCTSRGAPDTAGDNQNAVVRGGTNKLRRTVRRVLMHVPRLVVQEWVSPAHWQPHLGASRAPWTPEPRAQKEVSNENGSVALGVGTRERYWNAKLVLESRGAVLERQRCWNAPHPAQHSSTGLCYPSP